jgi:hypothetical protein
MIRNFVRAGVPAAFVVFTLASCTPDPADLRTGAQATRYIRDATLGKHLNWKLSANAEQMARHAWEHEEDIAAVGETLREEGPDWACHIAELLHAAGESAPNGLSLEEETQIDAIATQYGVTTTANDSFVTQARTLSRAEIVAAVNAVCKLSEF